MILVAKTRIASPDFVVLLESVGEVVKNENNKTKTKKKRHERYPSPSFFVSRTRMERKKARTATTLYHTTQKTDKVWILLNTPEYE